MRDPRLWQRAIAAHLPTTLALGSFDLAGFHGTPRFVFQTVRGPVSAHAQSRDRRLHCVCFLVYAKLPVFSWSDPPDGLFVVLDETATPDTTCREIMWAAAKLASTRCHAGAEHTPGISRGTYGELCTACWASVRRILDVDKEPLPF